MKEKPIPERFSMYMTRPAREAVKMAMAESGMSRARQIETWMRESPEAKIYLSRVRTEPNPSRDGDNT